MRAVDLLRHVRDAQPLEPQELRDFINDVTSGKVPDYQAAAFLMAVYHVGLSDDLTVAMTLAMRDSGQVITHPDVPGLKVDKHSTGGVGDKLSIPLAPWVAACGVPVPMISGRGLGHTGGTLDKLESIAGFRVDLSIDTFRQTLAKSGLCLIGQTEDLAPADRKLYALRDVTSTVESIPLITSSILSKKLAEGIDALVLDVKVGRGAFMKDEASARKLAESLVRVGTGAGLRVRALLTRMDEPLGRMVGNALEIKESIDILQGKGPKDTTELTQALAMEMLQLGGVADTVDAAKAMLDDVLQSGKAFDKFREIVQLQGGDVSVIDNPDKLPAAEGCTDVCAQQAGYITAIDAMGIGLGGMHLGAGRATAEDRIDPAVGVELLHKTGDQVAKGDVLAVLHHNRDPGTVVDDVRKAFTIGSDKVAVPSLVIDTID